MSYFNIEQYYNKTKRGYYHNFVPQIIKLEKKFPTLEIHSSFEGALLSVYYQGKEAATWQQKDGEHWCYHFINDYHDKIRYTSMGNIVYNFIQEDMPDFPPYKISHTIEGIMNFLKDLEYKLTNT